MISFPYFEADLICAICEQIWWSKDDVIENKDDPRCPYCGAELSYIPDPNQGPYDTLEEKWL